MGSLALAVFLVVAALASFSVREVQRDGEMLAKDTFPGLVNAGEAISRSTENWVNMYMLLDSKSESERLKLVSEINRNSTQPIWNRYKRAIYIDEDLRLFKQVEDSRNAFISARAECFRLVADGKMEEAKAYFDSKLRPAFERYRSDAVNIFFFNAKAGQHRADRLINLARWTPYALASFCVLVLLTGVFVGFKASLGAFSSGWTAGSEAQNRGSPPA